MKYISKLAAACLMILAVTDLCHSQESQSVNMAQYLFPEFTECIIKSKTGSVTTETGNYNTITGKMAFMKDGVIYGLTTARQADTITIDNRHFVPFGEFIYEVVVNAPITLFIQHESRLIPPGQQVGYGGTSKVSKVNTYSHMSTREVSTASRFHLISRLSTCLCTGSATMARCTASWDVPGSLKFSLNTKRRSEAS